ncbi:MAG: hypothetical protein ACRDFB_05845 [Rhabdochlamydiaceae bacterium]
MTITSTSGINGSISQVQMLAPTDSETQVKEYLALYDGLSLTHKKKFMETIQKTMDMKDAALEILLRTLFDIKNKLEKHNQEVKEWKKQDQANRDKSSDPVNLEQLKHKVEKTSEALEKAKFERQQADLEAKQADLEADKADWKKEKIDEALKRAQQEKQKVKREAEENRSYLIIGWKKFQTIKEQFIQKVFKNPAENKSFEPIRYTYLNSKNLIIGASVVGGIFFLRGSAQVAGVRCNRLSCSLYRW